MFFLPFFAVLNLLMIYSLKKELFLNQLLFWFLGAIIVIFFKKINLKSFFRFNHYLYGISIFLLILPFFIGVITHGSRRWVNIIGINFQPSEIVKPLLIIFFVNFFSRVKIKNFFSFLATLALILFPVSLIILEPDLGSGSILFLTIIILFFISFPKINWWLAIFLTGLIPLFLFGKFFIHSYQVERVKTFFNPSLDPLGKSYNMIQAKIAVGSGGVWGRGYGFGRQTQLAFLPEKHTDFIFASIAEELGFWGISFCLLFYIYFLLWLILHLRTQTGDREFFFLRLGIFVFFFLQSAINIAMNLGLFPIVGITLPFISYGGSSLISSFALLTLFLGF